MFAVAASLSATVDAELGLADTESRRDDFAKEREAYQQQLQDASAKLEAATRPAPIHDEIAGT